MVRMASKKITQYMNDGYIFTLCDKKILGETKQT